MITATRKLPAALLSALIAGCTAAARPPPVPTESPPAAAETRTPQLTAELRGTMSPDDVYQAFKDGHQRFRSGKLRYRKLVLEIEDAKAGQHPYAIVLSCIDSRVPVETIFDKQIGDIFGTRIAGNVLNEDVLGGMEFATHFAGAKLIMVMGHTKCGAVKGAVAGVEFGHLTGLLDRIEPAVATARQSYAGKQEASNYDFVDAASAANVALVRNQIRERSPQLRQMEAEGKIKIVGTMYDLNTGSVTFYD